jgi:hypothetical protein
MSAAVCDLCALPVGSLWAIVVNLLAIQAGVSTDPQSLMNGAKCIECNIPPGALIPIMVSLLAQQVAGGGGATATNIIIGAALVPVTPPTTTTSPAIYYSDTANPTLAVWSVANQAWVVLIVGS